MKKASLLQVFLTLAIAALFVCGQQVFAAEVPHHWHVKVLPHQPTNRSGEASDAVGAAPAAGLYGIGQAFVETPLGQSENTAGAELWPCFGGSGTAQPDCAFIGSTGTADAASLSGSAVLGTPAYVWYLNVDTTDAPNQPFGCAATTTADTENYCGQTNTWYEDWSGDTADELTYLLEATQNGSVVADSGTVDFGPNSYGANTPVADVVIYGDQNFGTDGVATGPNNGNCEANFNYPIPGAYYAPITAISESGTTVTVTANNSFATAGGDYVYITGTTNANYNGALAVITSATATSFKYTAATSGLGTAGSGGQAITYYDSTNNYVAYPIIVAAKKTCVDPVASGTISGAVTAKEVKLSATTEIEKAAYTKSTSATTCGVGNTPCYTIKYTEVTPDKLSQSWYIWLR